MSKNNFRKSIKMSMRHTIIDEYIKRLEQKSKKENNPKTN
jgi:hypothetical protein